MFNKTGIEENYIFGPARLNLFDYLIIGRWDYALGAISCAALLFGIVQTCLTSKLMYVLVLLSLLLIASISSMAENFYYNWSVFYEYSNRDSSDFEKLNPINGGNYDTNAVSFTRGLNYFSYYTA